MGVVPGCTLLVGKVSDKGENLPDRGSLTESFGGHRVIELTLMLLVLIWPKLNNSKKPEND